LINVSLEIEAMKITQPATAPKKVIFLTGATGHVGRNLIPGLLRSDPGARLLVLIRARSSAEAAARLDRLLSGLAPAVKAEEGRRRVSAVCGDITRRWLGLSKAQFNRLASRVTHIIHSAAATKFNLPLEEARRVNRLGTENVMELARSASQRGVLRRVAHISTAFVSGDRSGWIREGELDCGQGFSNTYEQSKFEAERFLDESCRDLPLVVFRPSIIVGDSHSGATTAFNVLYIPLKYLVRGYLRFVPGRADTPLDVVPVDYVCSAICHILFHTEEAEGRTFHLCAGPEKATTVGEVLGGAADYFNRLGLRPKAFRLRFISPSWLAAVKLAEPFLSRPLKKWLRKARAFLPHLKIVHAFDTSGTDAALRGTGVFPPLFQSYFQVLLRYCLEANWGEGRAQTVPGFFVPDRVPTA
jgi:thioester reductase-like protein